MRGNLQKYEIRDLMNPSNLEFVNKISQIWDDHVGTSYKDRDYVILEQVGGWLCQAAWHDEVGYHIKFRMHPLYAHSPDVQRRARRVMEAFIGLFPKGKVVHSENTDILDLDLSDIDWRDKEKLGLTKTITVVIETDSYSIGD